MGKGTVAFENADHFQVIDFVAVGISVTALLGYHIGLYVCNRRAPHKSLSSHVDYHQIHWGRKAFEIPMERIALIQCMRTNLMIAQFFCSIAVIAAATLGREGFQVKSFPNAIRSMTPCALYFVSFCHFCFFAWSYYHMSFLYLFVSREAEPGVDASQPHGTAVALAVSGSAYTPPEGNGTKRRDANRSEGKEGAAVFGYGAAVEMGPVSPGRADKEASESVPVLQQNAVLRHLVPDDVIYLNKLHGASLQRRATFHFRQGWRFTVAALVFMLWPLSPVLLIIGSLLAVAQFYANDFPFPASMTERFRPDPQGQRRFSVSPEHQLQQSSAGYVPVPETEC